MSSSSLWGGGGGRWHGGGGGLTLEESEEAAQSQMPMPWQGLTRILIQELWLIKKVKSLYLSTLSLCLLFCVKKKIIDLSFSELSLMDPWTPVRKDTTIWHILSEMVPAPLMYSVPRAHTFRRVVLRPRSLARASRYPMVGNQSLSCQWHLPCLLPGMCGMHQDYQWGMETTLSWSLAKKWHGLRLLPKQHP